jgi:hypothetical protein
MRLVPLYIAVIWTIFFADISYAQAGVLNIIYTGGVAGELEPCGCSPKADIGGLVRRAGYIEDNSKDLSPYILVDAGNFLGEDTPQGRLKAEAMLRSLAAMSYDVVAGLENERGFPPEFLSDLLRRFRIPFVSNLEGFRRSFSMMHEKIKINLSVDPEGFKEGELNILLTDAPISDVRSIKGWDLAILSSSDSIDEPQSVDGKVIVVGYPKGERLGILRLKINDQGDILDFENRWQSLGKDIKESEVIKEILKDYDSKVAKLLRDEYKPAVEETYIGVSRCTECHQPYFDSWRVTAHARAWNALERVGKSNDPECIRCHVVGFGEDGGFHRIDTTPTLADVQCEACHGEGAEHIKGNYNIVQEVNESICLRCHKEENSPDFDYSVYLNKVNHKEIWEE